MLTCFPSITRWVFLLFSCQWLQSGWNWFVLSLEKKKQNKIAKDFLFYILSSSSSSVYLVLSPILFVDKSSRRFPYLYQTESVNFLFFSRRLLGAPIFVLRSWVLWPTDFAGAATRVAKVTRRRKTFFFPHCLQFVVYFKGNKESNDLCQKQSISRSSSCK